MNIPVKQISYTIRIAVNGKLKPIYTDDYEELEQLQDKDPHITAFNKDFYKSTNY